jgi:hypothetical protein
MRRVWPLLAPLAALILLGAWPTEGALSTRHYLPMVPRDATPTPTPRPMALGYRANVEGLGWLDWQAEGGTAGTTGQGRKLLGLQMELQNPTGGAALRFRGWNDADGWSAWQPSGGTIGPITPDKPLGAIELSLDNPPSGTSTSTEAYVNDWGWLGAVRDQWIAGTQHQGRPMEAFRASIRRGSPEPARIHIAYNASIQSVGYTGWKRDTDVAGSTGQQLRLEVFRMALYNHPESMSVEYQAYVHDDGWYGWVRDGAEMGSTVGLGRAIYAFQVRLVNAYPGTVLGYDGHFQNAGWLRYSSDSPSNNNPILGDPNAKWRLEAMSAGLAQQAP